MITVESKLTRENITDDKIELGNQNSVQLLNEGIHIISPDSSMVKIKQ